MNQANQDIVGRGNKEGGALFRSWFGQLTEQAEQNNRVPYVFVMGSMNEILKSFDFPVVFPEVNSLQTAIRKDSANLLNQAEDYGYSPDICGYDNIQASWDAITPATVFTLEYDNQAAPSTRKRCQH